MIFQVYFLLYFPLVFLYLIISGVGTLEFKKSTYSDQVNLSRYDFCMLIILFFFLIFLFYLVLIISRTRFTENDLWLANEIKRIGKRFFFIRTNLDQDLYNEKIDHPKNYNETMVLHRIRENCLAHIQTVDETPNVFLISGRINYTSR